MPLRSPVAIMVENHPKIEDLATGSRLSPKKCPATPGQEPLERPGVEMRHEGRTDRRTKAWPAYDQDAFWTGRQFGLRSFGSLHRADPSAVGNLHFTRSTTSERAVAAVSARPIRASSSA